MKNFTRSILLALCLPAMLVSCGNGGNAPKNPGEKLTNLQDAGLTMSASSESMSRTAHR